MGRGKTVKAPSFQNSVIQYGDQVVGKTYRDKNTGAIVTQYYPDTAEQQRKQLVQQKINDVTATLGITAPELSQQYSNTENSFINDATQKFLDQYNPTVKDLRENIASRFGTLNSSDFVDSLNDLEKNKASALADIVNRGKQIKYDLVNQNEANKLNTVQALGGLLSSDQTNFLNNLSSSISSDSYLNDFLNSQWMTKLSNYRQNLNNQSSLAQSQGIKGYLLSKLLG